MRESLTTPVPTPEPEAPARRLRVVLESDFHDYYDYAFDAEYPGDYPADPANAGAYRFPGTTYYLERRAKTQRSRQEDHDILARAGYSLPERGSVREVHVKLQKRHRWNTPRPRFEALAAAVHEVVVYTEPTLHRGEGKERMRLAQALEECPEAYCTEYVPGETTLRQLQVGKRRLWLAYHRDPEQPHEWRTNVGWPHIELLSEEEGYTPYLKYPLYAVDFVISNGLLLAIDFNPAPGMRGSRVLQERLPPREIYSLIRDYYRDVP